MKSARLHPSRFVVLHRLAALGLATVGCAEGGGPDGLDAGGDSAAVDGSGSGGFPSGAPGGTPETPVVEPPVVDGGGGTEIADGGYFSSGTWAGYAWVATNAASATPADFAALEAGEPLCISGSVAATADYSGVAMLGVNLNQAEGEGTAVGTVVSTKDGLAVRVSNPGGSPLRVQIQGPAGETSEDDRWCASISGSGGTIPYGQFNTRCWDGSGAAYAGQPLVSAAVLVPGSNMAATPFDFCLSSLADESGGPTGGPERGLGTGTMEVSGVATGRYDSANVSRNGVGYRFIANGWGNNWQDHNISYSGTSFSVNSFNGSVGANWSPAGYPSVYCGKYSEPSASGTCGLPKRLSEMSSLRTGWSWSRSGAGSDFNAAWDIWMGDGTTRLGYYMVWLHAPSSFWPAGSKVQSGLGIPGLPGSWDIWHGTVNTGDGDRPITNYVATTSMGSLEFDVLELIADAQQRGYGVPGDQVNAVAIGFEIWNGYVSDLETTDFYVAVE